MKKRYLLLALSLISAVGLSSVGSYALPDKKEALPDKKEALPDKKEALTPPTDYDYSLRWLLHDYDFNDWYWGTKNNPRQTLLKFDSGVEGVSGTVQKVFSWTYQYPLGTTYGALVIDMTIKSTSMINYWTSGHFGGTGWFWDSQTVNRNYPTISLTMVNNSPFPIRVLFDFSSNANNVSVAAYVNNLIIGNDIYLYRSTLSGFTISPYDTLLVQTGIEFQLDAIYFDLLPIPTQLNDVLDDYFDMGITYEEINGVNWFDTIFIQGFGGVLSFIGNYEVLPNLKVFYIIGFTMVLAIVGFVAGQRKKE